MRVYVVERSDTVNTDLESIHATQEGAQAAIARYKAEDKKKITFVDIYSIREMEVHGAREQPKEVA